MNEKISESKASASEDAGLAKQFQGGNKLAFDRLVLKYQDRIFNLCYRLLGNRAEASDSAQDTFVRVYRSLNRFRFESAFFTWLYRVAVNTCKNKLRSQSYRYRRRMVSLGNPGEGEEGHSVLEVGDESRSPLRELTRRERGALVQHAVDSLPPDQKLVVVLRDIDGLSYQEVSAATGYSLGTVKSKLSRARRLLREKLKGVL
jgi:RNA polymerase sigma-70 factor (ECF subfamily)